MQKTKLGITVGLLGAITYFAGLFSGILAMAIIAGYVLINEENEWLKKAVVKAIVLSLVFSVASTVIGLIPNAISTVNSVLGLINFDITIPFISELVSCVQTIIGFVERILFLVLGLKALNQGTISVPVVDDIVNKNME